MGTKRPGAVLLAALVLAACTTSRQRMPRVAPQTARATPERIQEMVRQAIQLDVAADRAADTLYAPEALVVANARVRFAAPRFAGVGYGGRVTITAATVTLEGRFAWVMVDYRWFNLERNQAEAGRATFVCEEQPSGWKIVHVHSSQVLPWDR
ncbi:MAG: hypothetical protein AUH46_03415 [Gemmatimonadetes bacterium 13_1_40CM_70_15]|nr:MAG: hypothetical protein AUH46_03415 [Gemmatimonadetes bacterium 13_1_40CM_70_15]